MSLPEPTVDLSARPSWAEEISRLKLEVDSKAAALAKNRALLDDWRNLKASEIEGAFQTVHPLIRKSNFGEDRGVINAFDDVMGDTVAFSAYKDDAQSDHARLASQISKLLQSISEVAGVGMPAQSRAWRKGDVLSGFRKGGANIRLSGDCSLASKFNPTVPTGNLVFGDGPLPVGSSGAWCELVVKRVSMGRSIGEDIDGLTVGVTLTDPSTLSKFAPADGLPGSSPANPTRQVSWRIPKSFLIGFNGQQISDSTAWTTTDGYHPGELVPGDRVGILIPSYGGLRGKLLLFVNQKLRCIGPGGIPADTHQVFLIVDLLGGAEAVSLLPAGKTNPPSLAGLDPGIIPGVEKSEKNSGWGKCGSNISLCDGVIAKKKDERAILGGLALGNGPLPWWRRATSDKEMSEVKKGGDFCFFEIRVKKLSAHKSEKKHQPPLISLGMICRPTPPLMLPPTAAQLTEARWFDLPVGAARLRVGDTLGVWGGGGRSNSWKLVLFLNGRFFGEKEFPGPIVGGTVWGIVGLEGGVSAVGLIGEAAPPAEAEWEILRSGAVRAVARISRWWRSRSIRKKWRNCINEISRRAKSEKESSLSLTSLLQKQLILQEKLLQKLDGVIGGKLIAQSSDLGLENSSKPVNVSSVRFAGNSRGPGPNYQIPHSRSSGVWVGSSGNVRVSGGKLSRLDAFKGWAVLEGFGGYLRMEISCDKKTLGMAIGTLDHISVAENVDDLPFVNAISLNGEIKKAGDVVGREIPRATVDQGVVEVFTEGGLSASSGILIVVVGGKLLGKIPSAWILGIEFWGGVKGVSIKDAEQGTGPVRGQSWGWNWPANDAEPAKDANNVPSTQVRKYRKAADRSEIAPRPRAVPRTVSFPATPPPEPSFLDEIVSVFSAPPRPSQLGKDQRLSDQSDSEFSGSIASTEEKPDKYNQERPSTNFMAQVLGLIPDFTEETIVEEEAPKPIDTTRRGRKVQPKRN